MCAMGCDPPCARQHPSGELRPPLERMNSPLEIREVRLRGLLPRDLLISRFHVAPCHSEGGAAPSRGHADARRRLKNLPPCRGTAATALRAMPHAGGVQPAEGGVPRARRPDPSLASGCGACVRRGACSLRMTGGGRDPGENTGAGSRTRRAAGPRGGVQCVGRPDPSLASGCGACVRRGACSLRMTGWGRDPGENTGAGSRTRRAAGPRAECRAPGGQILRSRPDAARACGAAHDRLGQGSGGEHRCWRSNAACSRSRAECHASGGQILHSRPDAARACGAAHARSG
jgi:hypothetical protein